MGTGHDLGPIDEQEARAKTETHRCPAYRWVITVDATVKQRLIERLTQADTAAQKWRTTGRLTQRNEAVSYETTFASDRFNEHRSEEYLFKLGCALIEQHWKEQVRTARALARSLSATLAVGSLLDIVTAASRHCCGHTVTPTNRVLQRGTHNPLSLRLLGNALGGGGGGGGGGCTPEARYPVSKAKFYG